MAGQLGGCDAGLGQVGKKISRAEGGVNPKNEC
jgi:hypothetical protein